MVMLQSTDLALPWLDDPPCSQSLTPGSPACAADSLVLTTIPRASAGASIGASSLAPAGMSILEDVVGPPPLEAAEAAEYSSDKAELCEKPQQVQRGRMLSAERHDCLRAACPAQHCRAEYSVAAPAWSALSGDSHETNVSRAGQKRTRRNYRAVDGSSDEVARLASDGHVGEPAIEHLRKGVAIAKAKHSLVYNELVSAMQAESADRSRVLAQFDAVLKTSTSPAICPVFTSELSWQIELRSEVKAVPSYVNGSSLYCTAGQCRCDIDESFVTRIAS